MPWRWAGAAAASLTSRPCGAAGPAGAGAAGVTIPAPGPAPGATGGAAAMTGGASGPGPPTSGTSAYSGGAAGGPAAACGGTCGIAPGGAEGTGGAAAPGGAGASTTASSSSGSPFFLRGCLAFGAFRSLAGLGWRGAFPTDAPIEAAIRATSASWQAGHVKTSLVSAMHVGQMPFPHSRHFPIACWPGCRSHST
jgi:hypothetical protein